MQTLSRRSLFKSSLVAGISAAATGCGDQYGKPGTLPAYTVRLLCSGMMAFYWEKTTKSLRIVIPPPKMGGAVIHLIRFGGIGGGPLGEGDYRLDLPGYNEPKTDPYPEANPQNEIVFGRDNQGKPTPTLKMKTVGTYARVTIPNPTRVQPYRWITKVDQTKPFFAGDAANFAINPTTIPALYIVTYENVTGPAGLYGISGTSATPVVYSQPTRNLNIHLYSERPYNTPAMDHIDLFNGMFDHADNGQPLSLVHDKTTTDGDLACLEKETVPDYLSLQDLATLCELGITHDSKWLPPGACPKVADPAGCSDGWVFS
jgi:hypothetical protein